MGILSGTNLNQEIRVTTTVLGDAIAVENHLEPGFGDPAKDAEFMAKTLLAVVSMILPEAIAPGYAPPSEAVLDVWKRGEFGE